MLSFPFTKNVPIIDAIIPTADIISGKTAPITPYISDEIYTKLTGEESVHLADFPKFNENLVNEEVEEKNQR